jgi:hypothetical protein
MLLFVKTLLYLISDFAILYTILCILYHIKCFLHRLYRLVIDVTEERLRFIIYSCILRLKISYLPTSVRKWIKNVKPCCFSLDCQSKLQHAIQNNHIDCLKKAFKNGCEWNSYICNMLMLLNHKECLLYAHSNGCDWDFCTCDELNEDVNASSVGICVENGLHRINNNIRSFADTNICDKLAVVNDEKSLLFAHSNGHDWDCCTCDDVNDLSECVNNGLYKIHVLPTLVA